MRSIAKIANQFRGCFTMQSLRKWGLIAGVLVATHLASAKIGYDRLDRNVYEDLTINSPLEEWANASPGADASVYLSVAINFAKGKGLIHGPDRY